MRNYDEMSTGGFWARREANLRAAAAARNLVSFLGQEKGDRKLSDEEERHTQWQSTGYYEHPMAHRNGTCGQLVQTMIGIYCMLVGGVVINVPQDWAAQIRATETVKR